MKINKLALVFGFVLILSFIMVIGVNADKFDDAYNIPEKLEYQALYTELNELVKTYDAYDYREGTRIHECFRQMSNAADVAIMEYQEGLGVRNGGIQNCVNEDLMFFPDIRRMEDRWVACIKHVANPIDREYYNKLIEHCNNAKL